MEHSSFHHLKMEKCCAPVKITAVLHDIGMYLWVKQIYGKLHSVYDTRCNFLVNMQNTVSIYEHSKHHGNREKWWLAESSCENAFN